MKKKLTIMAVLIAALSFAWSVSAEEITIVGTGSGSTVLKAVGDAFAKQNPGVTISVPKSIGSGGGIKAVGNDKNVLGRVARNIKDREKSFGLTYVEYAKMPIVFFVNASVKVSNLTEQQACDIYSGKITNWQEIGGNNGKIRVIRREDGDSSLEVLQETLSCFKDLAITKRSKTTYSDPDTVATSGKTKDSIAFGTWPNVMGVKTVRALNINGNKPTDDAYNYVGKLALIYKQKNLTGNVKKFVDYATSSKAASTIVAAGAIPSK